MRALLVVFVLLTGCTGAAIESTSTDLPRASTSVVTSTTGPLSTSTSTSTAQVDAAGMLNEGLAASSSNYAFSSVVIVGEETLTSITGVVDGEAVAATIVTGASEVSYVRTSDGEWATDSGGAWVELEGEPPVGAPLGALADAGGLTVESGNADTGVVNGVLGPAAGQAEGLRFTLTLEDGYITEIRYQVETGGEVAQVITTLGEFGAAGTVAEPEGA